jgi:hypothetical protein
MREIVGTARNASDFEPQRLAGHALERRRMTAGRPQFKFRVARGAQLQQIVVAAVVKVEPRDGLRVAAVEAFGEAQNRGQGADGAARPPAHVAESIVAALRRRLPVIARDERDGLDFVGLEAAQIAVANQIVGVFVMLLVADVDADVVQNRSVLEPLALAIGQAVNRPRLVEQRESQTRHVLRVVGKIIAPLGELVDAAPAHVRIAIGLRDFLAMPRDVVEDEPFAQ